MQGCNLSSQTSQEKIIPSKSSSYIIAEGGSLYNSRGENSSKTPHKFNSISEISTFFKYSQHNQDLKGWQHYNPITDQSCLEDPRIHQKNVVLPKVDVALIDPQIKKMATVDLYKRSYKNFKTPKYSDQRKKLQQ